MMDWTDRRCRAFHRLLTRRARLYTEMVTADAVVFGPRERLIGFGADEHPVALQLGGADPSRLAEASRIGADFGYDEINLNCGCPSDRVQSGRFGACLMREPALVADCVAAMISAVCQKELYVYAFDTMAYPIEAAGKDWAAWKKAFEGINAGGETSVGVSLELMRRRKQGVEQVIIVTDEEGQP